MLTPPSHPVICSCPSAAHHIYIMFCTSPILEMPAFWAWSLKLPNFTVMWLTYIIQMLFLFFFFTLNFSNFYLVSWNPYDYRWGGFAYRGIKWREFLEFLKGKTYTKGRMATSWIKRNYFRPKVTIGKSQASDKVKLEKLKFGEVRGHLNWLN